MRGRASRVAAAAGACALLAGLGACAPQAPQGVDKDKLDAAVSRAIGDPNTCVLIAERTSGRVVYRYNTHTACARALPACDGAGGRTVDDLLKLTLKDGQPRTLSCNSTADGSRGVGWASGLIQPKAGRKPLAYAAMMEGARAFPGMMMADRLDRAFADAGVK